MIASYLYVCMLLPPFSCFSEFDNENPIILSNIYINMKKKQAPLFFHILWTKWKCSNRFSPIIRINNVFTSSENEEKIYNFLSFLPKEQMPRSKCARNAVYHLSWSDVCTEDVSRFMKRMYLRMENLQTQQSEPLFWTAKSSFYFFSLVLFCSWMSKWNPTKSSIFSSVYLSVGQMPYVGPYLSVVIKNQKNQVGIIVGIIVGHR